MDAIFILISLLFGILVGGAIGCIVLIKMYKAIINNYVTRDEFEDAMNSTNKRVSFVIDCLECFNGKEIDYDKFRKIQKYKEQLNLK